MGIMNNRYLCPLVPDDLIAIFKGVDIGQVAFVFGLPLEALHRRDVLP